MSDVFMKIIIILLVVIAVFSIKYALQNGLVVDLSPEDIDVFLDKKHS